MKATIEGVEVVVELKEETKENEDVIDLTKFDKRIQLTIVEIQEAMDDQDEKILTKMTRKTLKLKKKKMYSKYKVWKNSYQMQK
jgi:hypothetical protein